MLADTCLYDVAIMGIIGGVVLCGMFLMFIVAMQPAPERNNDNPPRFP